MSSAHLRQPKFIEFWWVFCTTTTCFDGGSFYDSYFRRIILFLRQSRADVVFLKRRVERRKKEEKVTRSGGRRSLHRCRSDEIKRIRAGVHIEDDFYGATHASGNHLQPGMQSDFSCRRTWCCRSELDAIKSKVSRFSNGNKVSARCRIEIWVPQWAFKFTSSDIDLFRNSSSMFWLSLLGGTWKFV